MHVNNIRWLHDTKDKYLENFKHCRVLELGSGGGVDVKILSPDLLAHSSLPQEETEALLARMVKPLFENCNYIGVDIAEGIGVDVVANAKDTEFKDGTFDTLVCLSMFEHDPTWRESISHNIPFLKKDGLLITCWGAEGNLHHGPEPWAMVPWKEVVDFLKTLGLKIEDSFFEEERYGPDCPGCYDVIARKI